MKAFKKAMIIEPTEDARENIRIRSLTKTKAIKATEGR